MNADQVAVLLAQTKSAQSWSGWAERSNHAGSLLNVAPLLDAQGITMPGATVELEVKANSTVLSCFFLFTIMLTRHRNRGRAFQLEVVPASKRSHVGVSVIHGPHEHILEDEPTAVSDPRVNCDSWRACADWFFARAGIAATAPQDPFTP